MLVLNQNYEPLLVCNAKRALVLLFLGKAEVVENSDYFAASIRRRFILPSVVRLGSFIRRPRLEVKLSKQNIFRRDRHVCQYCGTSQGTLTIDHLVPKSLGGDDTWDNLVCACTVCNNKKANRSLKQSRMTLIKKPRRPHYFSFIQYSIHNPDDNWKPYLFLGKA
ncbi:MAG: HNH endonuclease [Candidatus Edwardsbacteria bacterium]|nr:HNH endonuclease [Candidatus Edwardsbacteria bacterium]